MPKAKRRGKGGNRTEKEKPLLTVQGVLRLDKCFVTAQHDDAPTVRLQRKEGEDAEDVKLVPGQSEHDMVQYKAGYDVGPSNPNPQNETESAILEAQRKVEARQEAFEEMKRQSEVERAEREARFRLREEERRRELGLMPDAPPGTEEEEQELEGAEQELEGAKEEETPKEAFNPDDPSNYVLPKHLRNDPAFHNDTPLEFGAKPLPVSAPSEVAESIVQESSPAVAEQSQEKEKEAKANEETLSDKDMQGEETQEIPDEMLPQMKPLPGNNGSKMSVSETRKTVPAAQEDMASMALDVAKEVEEERKKKARERLLANESGNVEEDHNEMVYSLDEITQMNEAFGSLAGGPPVQGPELSQQNIEEVVKQQRDQNAKNILDGYWQFVRENPQDFNGWCYLIQHVENMDDLGEIRSVYNAFLPLFPYCYAYWQRYSEAEKKHQNWQRSLAILHRGLEAIPLCVDLWMAYLELYHRMYQSHEDFSSLFRVQCERAIQTVGLEYKADPLWERYIEWELERKSLSWVTGIYKRLVGIPMRLYNKHWDNFIAHIRDHHPRDILEYEDYDNLRKITCKELNLTYRPDPVIQPSHERAVVMPEDKLKAGMKERIVASAVADHERCEEEVDKRFRFEEKIKRNYFHVKPLDLRQLRNWESYLNFEISSGDHERVVVLFERCLIPAAQYEQLWAKYARYLEQHHKTQGKSTQSGGESASSQKESPRKVSPLKKARFLFSTGLTKVDEIREKRCTWTLRGWKGTDKDGNEVLMAEEVPKEKPRKTDKSASPQQGSDEKPTPEAAADEQIDEDSAEEEKVTEEEEKATESDEAVKENQAKEEEKGTEKALGDGGKQVGTEECSTETPPEEDAPGFHQKAINMEMSDVTKTPLQQESTKGREAVRDVYKRACIVHCPKKAVIKLKWAAFEEECGEVERAREILFELNKQYPLLLECCIQLIDLERRLGNLERADELYRNLMKKIPQNRKSIKTWVALKYARYQFKVRGLPDKALATLRMALKRERGDPKLYAQVRNKDFLPFPIIW